MKHYRDWKKLFKILILLFLFALPAAFLHAQTAADIQAKIDQRDADIQKLEQQISSYQSQLDAIGQQKSSLNNSLKQLDLTRKKLNADIAVTQNKIDKTNLTIQNLTSDIGTKEDAIVAETKSIINGIKSTDEFERSGILNTILSQNDFSSVWTDIDNITTIRQKLRQDITDLKQTKGQLENTRTQTIAAKNQLTKLKSQLTDQKSIVVQNTNDKNQLLKQTKNSEANYQKILQATIAERDAFEKELFDYEAQLQYVLDPSKLPQGRVLSWPLDKIFVTQLFGVTKDSRRLYTSGSHSGVDFKASVGTPVLAMANGVVAGIGNTDIACRGISFGKFIFIQYDNGLSSAYGHLSLIKVQKGQQVARGQVVGYSGATGHVTGPHLHVSLYAPNAAQLTTRVAKVCNNRQYTLPIAPVNAYLNVLDYLPPYTINTTILNNQPGE